MKDDAFERGRKTRRDVLGDAHVDRAEAATTPLTQEFQDLLTRYAWGEVWTRPGLERKTRRLITIAMMVALNRDEELRLHLRAARDAGVIAEEVKEVLLQAAVYCGLPAGNAAFRSAMEVFSQPGPAPRPDTA